MHFAFGGQESVEILLENTDQRARYPDKQTYPLIPSKSHSRAAKWLHLPCIAVAVKVAVPWLQNLQEEQAKRQGSCNLAPELPEEHSARMRGADLEQSLRQEAAQNTLSTSTLSSGGSGGDRLGVSKM